MPYPNVPDCQTTSMGLRMKTSTNDPSEDEWLTLNVMVDEFDATFDMKQKADRIALKLIQGACKEERMRKVLLLASRLHLRTSYEAAAKVVQYFNKPQIEQQILTMATEEEDVMDEDPFEPNGMHIEE